MAPEVAALAHEIEVAFAARSYPGDDRIVRSPPGHGSPDEELARRFFVHQDWREIVRRGSSIEPTLGMAALTFEGLAYYLPALLTLALDREAPYEVGDKLVFLLWSFAEEISSLLEPAERRAVVRWLEFLAGKYTKREYVRNDAQAALDHYWAYFTDQELGMGTHAIQK